MMRFQTNTRTSPKTGGKWGTIQLLFLMVILLSGIALAVEEKAVPVSYDLKVTIEPRLGTVVVRGKIGVPTSREFSKILKVRLTLSRSATNPTLLHPS